MKKLIILFIFTCTLLVPDMRDCFGQNITWQKVLNNNYGSISKIQQTTDGGYIAVGNDRLNNQNKIYVTKLDSLGMVEWFKHIGLGENAGFWIEQTTDGGFILGGATNLDIGNSRAYLIKLDGQGNITWEKTFSNSDLDQCYCVKQTSDGGYILSCRTAPNRNGIFLIKTNSGGVEEWRKIYYDNNTSISSREIEIIDNRYFTSGHITMGSQTDIYIMRLNNLGDSIWTKRIGGNFVDVANAIDKISSNAFVGGGTSHSSVFNYNSFLFVMDTLGNISWYKSYSGLGSEDCYSVRYIANTGFIMAGTSDSLNNDIFKAKLRLVDLSGNTIDENSYTGPGETNIFNSVEQTSDGGFIAAGVTILSGSFPKMYIVKTDSLLASTTIGIENISNTIPSNFYLYQNYPNPFNPTTVIKFDIKQKTDVSLSIFDVLGKVIEEHILTDAHGGSYQFTWNATNFPTGVYFYRLKSKFHNESKKMILIK